MASGSGSHIPSREGSRSPVQQRNVVPAWSPGIIGVPWQEWARGPEFRQLTTDSQQGREMLLYNEFVYMHILLIGAPHSKDVPQETVQRWLELVKAWQDSEHLFRQNQRFPARYMFYLEALLYSIIEKLPRFPQMPQIVPPGWQSPYFEGQRETLLRREVRQLPQHLRGDPQRILSEKDDPQDIIDEIARNRVLPLPWFGQYNMVSRLRVQNHLNLRGRWMYFVLKAATSNNVPKPDGVSIFREAYELIYDELLMLEAFCVNEGFCDFLPRGNEFNVWFSWDDLRETARSQPAVGSWNWDYYSSLYIEGVLEQVDSNKPILDNYGSQEGRIATWIVSAKRHLTTTLRLHTVTDNPFTVQQARVIVKIIQHMFNLLIVHDRGPFPLEPSIIPRWALEQLQVVIGGRFLQKPRAALTRGVLVGEARKPMPPNEFDCRYGQHVKSRRVILNQQLAEEEDGLTATDTETGEKPKRPSRMRRQKNRLGPFPRHLLTCEFWDRPNYKLANFPSIETVIDEGEVAIVDMPALPGPLIIAYGRKACHTCRAIPTQSRIGYYRVCMRWERSRCCRCKANRSDTCFWSNNVYGNISIKYYDQTGPRAVNFDENLPYQLLKKYWFNGQDDFEDGRPPEDWGGKPSYAGQINAKGGKTLTQSTYFRHNEVINLGIGA